MKVKNIAFSGFMAAILMGATGANAAISVASKDYVDTKSASAASSAIETEMLETGSIGSAIADAKSVGTAAQTAVNTLSKTVADNKTATDTALGARELTANKLTGDTVADTDLTTEKYMSAHTIAKYVDSELAGALDTGGAVTNAVNSAIEKAVTEGKVGEAIEEAVADKQDALTASNAGTNIAISTAADGTVTISSTYEYDDSVLEGRVSTAEGEIDTLQGQLGDAKLSDYSTTEQMTSAIQTATSNMATDDELSTGLASKQDKLTTGDFVKIEKDTVSGNTVISTTYTGSDSVGIADSGAIAVNFGAIADGNTATTVTGDAIYKALTEKITMPAICDKTTCVLTYDTVEKVPAWVPLAEPESEPEA